MVIGLVWLLAVLYSTPKFYFVQTVTNKVGNDTGEVFNAEIINSATKF